jgi:ribosomal protein L21
VKKELSLFTFHLLTLNADVMAMRSETQIQRQTSNYNLAKDGDTAGRVRDAVVTTGVVEAAVVDHGRAFEIRLFEVNNSEAQRRQKHSMRSSYTGLSGSLENIHFTADVEYHGIWRTIIGGWESNAFAEGLLVWV